MTFKEEYIKGEISFEDIDKHVYMWGMSDTTMKLGEYLGLNVDEEKALVEDSEEALEELLSKLREE